MYVGEKNPVQLCTNETYFPDDASGRPKKEKGTAGRNKFLEIDLPSYPPSVSAWAGALENVRSRVSEEDRATISFESYSVPDPAMFAHSDHGRTFMKHWLTTRESWIWRVTRGSTDDPSRKHYLPTKVWRDLLFFGFPNEIPPSAGPSSKGKLSSAEKRNRRLQSVRDALFDGNQELEVENTPQLLAWKGVPIPMPNDEPSLDAVEREVLWELYEFNFRFDLLIVDSQLANDKWKVGNGEHGESLKRFSQIGECFHGSDDSDFRFLPPAIPDNNVGLAANKLAESTVFVLRLARLMLDWKMPYDKAIPELVAESDKGKLTDIKAYKLTRAVAGAYCDGVYRILGRAAVTPHCMKPRVGTLNQ